MMHVIKWTKWLSILNFQLFMFMTFVVVAFTRADAFATGGSSVFPKGFLVAFAVRKTSPGPFFAFETHFVLFFVL
jgi:hypothetical protein